jgi:hypothetical protein
MKRVGTGNTSTPQVLETPATEATGKVSGSKGPVTLEGFAIPGSRSLELGGEAELRAYYKVPAETQRNGWTGSLDLVRDHSPTVDEHFSETWSVRDNAIVRDVNDLLRPDIESHLAALGFVQEGGKRGDRLAMVKTSIDSAIASRIGLVGMKLKPHEVMNSELMELANPVKMGAFERYVQRAAVYFDDQGKATDAYLITYGWPMKGPGLNEENIHWRANGQIDRVVMNTTLERTVALPFEVSLYLASKNGG